MPYFFPLLFLLDVTGFGNLYGEKENTAFATALSFPYVVHLKETNVMNKTI